MFPVANDRLFYSALDVPQQIWPKPIDTSARVWEFFRWMRRFLALADNGHGDVTQQLRLQLCVSSQVNPKPGQLILIGIRILPHQNEGVFEFIEILELMLCHRSTLIT